MKKLILIFCIALFCGRAKAQSGSAPPGLFEISIKKDTSNSAIKPSEFLFFIKDDRGNDFTVYELVINGVRIRNVNNVTPFIVKVYPDRKYDIKLVAMTYLTIRLPQIKLHRGETITVKLSLKSDDRPLDD
ncbi:hypothetical protein BH09BAC6_BH09BAC6_23090 [soil metagenome]|jgi:hypothetical protein